MIPRGTHDPKVVTEAVKLHGFYRIQDFFGQQNIDDLSEELDQMWDRSWEKRRDDDPLKNYESHITIKQGDSLVASSGNVGAVLDLEFFRNVMKQYYGKSKFRFANSRYVVCHPNPNPSDSLPLAFHVDQQNRFKFFVLLHDVGHECGATVVVPGKRQLERTKRRDFIEKGNFFGDFDNKRPEYDGVESHVLSGKKGDVIVLDTDCPHKAGHVRPGHLRKIWRIDFVCDHEAGSVPFELKLQQIYRNSKQAVKKAMFFGN